MDARHGGRRMRAFSDPPLSVRGPEIYAFSSFLDPNSEMILYYWLVPKSKGFAWLMMVASGPPINTPPSSFLRKSQLAIQNQRQAKSESSGLQGGIGEDGEHDEAPPRRHPRRRRGSRQSRCHRAGHRQ